MAGKVAAKVNPLSARLGLVPKKKKTVTRAKITKTTNPSSNPLLKRLNIVEKKRTTTRPVKPSNKSETTASKLIKGNPLMAALKGVRGKRIPSTKNEQKNSVKQATTRTRTRTTVHKAPLTIKNASLKSFLRISNLETGTSADDLKSVLAEIGGIESVKVTDLPSGSSLGEVLFKDTKNLKKAHDKLNGVVADGRVLKVTICDGRPSDLGSTKKVTIKSKR